MNSKFDDLVRGLEQPMLEELRRSVAAEIRKRAESGIGDSDGRHSRGDVGGRQEPGHAGNRTGTEWRGEPCVILQKYWQDDSDARGVAAGVRVADERGRSEAGNARWTHGGSGGGNSGEAAAIEFASARDGRGDRGASRGTGRSETRGVSRKAAGQRDHGGAASDAAQARWQEEASAKVPTRHGKRSATSKHHGTAGKSREDSRLSRPGGPRHIGREGNPSLLAARERWRKSAAAVKGPASATEDVSRRRSPARGRCIASFRCVSPRRPEIRAPAGTRCAGIRRAVSGEWSAR